MRTDITLSSPYLRGFLQPFKLRDTFFESKIVREKNGAEAIMWGILGQQSQLFDRFVTEEVTNFLIPDENEPR